MEDNKLCPGEFFGTLQMSVIKIWRDHLQSSDYNEHIILQEYYEGMIEKIDSLIETYQSVYPRVDMYGGTCTDMMVPAVSHLEHIRVYCYDMYNVWEGNQEMKVCLDGIVELVSSVLYKLKNLTNNNPDTVCCKEEPCRVETQPYPSLSSFLMQ